MTRLDGFTDLYRFQFSRHRFKQSILSIQFVQTSFITLLVNLFFDVFVLSFSFDFEISLTIKFEFIKLLGLFVLSGYIKF